jgi:hypothetical protein
MDAASDWPERLTINAWTGAAAAGSSPDDKANRWVLRTRPPEVRTFLKPPPLADPANWRDPRVGWGLVLAEKPGVSEADLASGADAPGPIRDLLAARAPAPVFRYRPGWPERFRLLRNYRDHKDVAISGSPPGVGPGALPRYLLLYGGPEEIPWELQYVLNAGCAVGRLALTGKGLDNYVRALLSGWKDAPARDNHAVVWATNHGPADITSLMRNSIASRVYEALHQDADFGPNTVFLDGVSEKRATGAALAQALAEQRPGLVVTTSHGQTGPLEDPAAMAAHLGLPVDQDGTPLDPGALPKGWSPGGAVWYAHACCSAGSDAQTAFDGLVAAGSEIDRVLKGVAGLGAKVSPLPTALLGADSPLRAFVGHVEPTFDWTLRQPLTGQFLTTPIRESLYDRLFQPLPVGWALRGLYDQLGALFGQYDASLGAFNRGENTKPALLWCLLAARDIQSMVLLGDPTVMFSRGGGR